jgi:hypothetical protein
MLSCPLFDFRIPGSGSPGFRLPTNVRIRTLVAMLEKTVETLY